MNIEDLSKDVENEKVVNPEHIGSSLDDSMNNMHKDWTIWDYIQSIFYRYFWNWLSSIPSEIKYFIQRGRRGYSDRDSWELELYLLDIILCNLVKRRINDSSIPATQGPDGQWRYNKPEWNEILNEMITGFYIVKKCCIGNELMYFMGITEEDKVRYNEIAKTRKFGKHRCVNAEEETRMNKAFDLFKKYFWCLSD